MSAQTVQEPGVELGEIEVNNMDPLTHVWFNYDPPVPGEPALCGYRAPADTDPSQAFEWHPNDRTCATCRRLLAEVEA